MTIKQKIISWFVIALIIQTIFGQNAREFGFQLGYYVKTGEWKKVIELQSYVTYEQESFMLSGVTLYVDPALYAQCSNWK